MSRASAVMLTAFIGLAAADIATAQVVKPRPSSTDRLLRPASVTATQNPDGSIRVTWSAVPGAASYSMRRSAPPVPSALINLPSSPDTQYVDRDVKPGTTYYYLVSAVNEAGIDGMKASAPPIKAEEPVKPVASPVGVKAALQGSMASISWSYPDQSPGLRFRVERIILTNVGGNWIPVVTQERCCSASDDHQNRPPDTRVRYRVVAIDSRGTVSAASASSNEIRTGAVPPADTTDTNTNPPTDVTTTPAAPATVLVSVVAPPVQIRASGPVLKLTQTSAFTSLGLRGARWISLDESVATVDGQGQVRARRPGTTHIVVTGTTSNGSIGSMVQRVDVGAR